jgi:integrase
MWNRRLILLMPKPVSDAETGAYRSLLDANYKPNTQADYNHALIYLKDFLQERYKLTWFAFLRKSTRATCDILSHFITYRFDQLEGRGLSSTIKAVYAVVGIRPHLRQHHLFAVPKRLLRGWSKLCPGKPWPPISWPAAVAIACVLHSQGHTRMGLAVLLAFAALLRCGELSGIRARDFMFPGADVIPGVGIREAKTGKNQWAPIVIPEVAQLCQELTQTLDPDELVFPFHPDTLRKHYLRVRDELALPGDLVFHSLRHGGATHQCLFLNVNLETLRHRGRWKSVASVERYLQEQRALLAFQDKSHAMDFGLTLLEMGLKTAWRRIERLKKRRKRS